MTIERKTDPSDGKKRHPPDPAYELFASQSQEHREIPYQEKKGDFVQLADLRERLNTNGRGMPDRSERAVRRYFETPQGKYTMADLCARYDVFFNHALDRFNKPVEEYEPKTREDILRESEEAERKANRARELRDEQKRQAQQKKEMERRQIQDDDYQRTAQQAGKAEFDRTRQAASQGDK